MPDRKIRSKALPTPSSCGRIRDMAAVVYTLCIATALSCCVLLIRGYIRSRARLLLWSGLCFAMLTLENLVLFIDQVVIPAIDISFLQLPVALAAVLFLLYGLIWEAK